MTGKRKQLLALLLACSIAFSLLCSCAPQNDPDEQTPSDPSTGTPDTADTPNDSQSSDTSDDKYGGTASFVISGDPLNINYFASQGGNTDGQIMMATSDWLTLYNPDTGEYEPRLLESWEMSEDGKEWTMHVRPGVKWHDGEPLTAEDIVFTLELMANPDLDIVDSESSLIEETYEIVDELTYKVITEQPNVSELADWRNILPKHIWENVDPSNFSKAAEGYLMVGCGPFKMTEYKVGEYIRFDRFDDYYGGKPYLDTIYYRIIGDSTAAIAALESGQVNCVTVDATNAEQLLNKEGISVWQGPSGNVNRMYFNLTTPQFEDVRVRQAVAHLMQRDVYVSQAMRGFADPAYSDFAPTDFYYVDDPYAQYEFSVEKACELLDEAGWVPGSDGIREKDGVRLEFEALYTSTAPQASAALLIMTPVFEQAGIKIIPKVPDEATLNELWDTHDFIFFNAGTTMGPDPMRYQYIFGTEAAANIMMYESEEVKELFTQAMGEFDQDKQRELYEQIQYKLAEDVPNLPLWYRHTIYAHTNDLVIEDASPVGYVHFRFLHMEKLYMK